MSLNMHHLSHHALYDEKVTHSLTQREGENYLPKIYIFKDSSGMYFKVGSTTHPISQRLSNLKVKYGRTMECIKSWILSEKFDGRTNEIHVETLENVLHADMGKLDFTHLQDTMDYFLFNNTITDEIWLPIYIGIIIEQYYQNDIVPQLPSVVIDHVKKGQKRKYTRFETPTKSQLKNRERAKKWCDDNRGNYIYFFSNGVDVGKIGETNLKPSQRLNVYNSGPCHFGKCELIWKWPLGSEYDEESARTLLEKRVLAVMGRRFARIGKAKEHFNVLPSEHSEVFELVNKIINN